MKSLMAVLAALVLLAGCTGSAAPTATTSPASASAGEPVAVGPSAVASAEPSCPGPACPDGTPAPVSARLTFDGAACVYTGPTVVTSPSSLRLEFAPTDEGYVTTIAQVEDTVTREEADRVNADESYGAAPGKKAPEWMLPGYWAAFMGTGTLDYEMRARTVAGKTYDQFVITCVKNPWAADKPADTIEGRTTAAIVKAAGD